MIAKVIAHGATRDEARERLARALDDTVALGVATNKAFLAAVLRDDEFAARRRPPISSPPLRAIEPRRAGCRDARHRGGAARRAAPASANGIPGATIRRATMRAKFGEQRRRPRAIRDDAYRAQIGDTAVVLRILSIDPPHARVAHRWRRGNRHVRDRRTTRFTSRAPAQSYSLENTVHAPARRAAGRERRPPRRADERPRGRGQRARPATRPRPGARWSCSKR